MKNLPLIKMSKRISAEFCFSSDSLIHAGGKSSCPALFRLNNINNVELRTAGIGIHFKRVLHCCCAAHKAQALLLPPVFPTFALNQKG